MKFTLIFLCVVALNACGDGDPVSSGQAGKNTGTTSKPVSSSVTISAPVAGLAESRASGPDTTKAVSEDPGDSEGETDTTDADTDVSTTNPDTTDTEPGAEPALPGTVVFSATPDSTEEWGADDFELSAAAITGDTLTVTVSYSGGCQDHHFTLVASASFLESLPVQLEVSLAHNANSDPCEAWLTEYHLFNLVPVKERFQDQYQDSGRIVLLLEDAPDELLYEFAE